MRTTTAVMIAGIATFLAAGLAQAGTEKGQSVRPARTHSTVAARAQADVGFYAVKVSKACTYRGGPKSGSWDCR